MKKLAAILLVFVMSFALCACGGYKESQLNSSESTDTEASMESADTEASTEASAENETNGTDNSIDMEESSVLIEQGDFTAIKSTHFGECFDKVELTIDNWKNYIQVISYSREEKEIDAFGEVVSTHTEDCWVFGMQTEKFYGYEDVVIELKNLETGEKVIINFDEDHFVFGQPNDDDNVGAGGNYIPLDGDFDINKYECTRIKGRVHLGTPPEEAIYSTPTELGFFVMQMRTYEMHLCGINPYTKEFYVMDWNRLV